MKNEQNAPIQDMLGYIRLFQTVYNRDMDYLANHNGNNDDMFQKWDIFNDAFEKILNKNNKKKGYPESHELEELLNYIQQFKESIQGFQQQGFEVDENSNAGSQLNFYTDNLTRLIEDGIRSMKKNKGCEWETIIKAKKEITATLPDTLVEFYQAYSKYFWSVKEDSFKNVSLTQSNYPTFFGKIFDDCYAIGNDQAHYAALNSKTAEQREIFNRWYDIVSFDSDILIGHLIRLARNHPCYKKYKADREAECSIALEEPIKLDTREQLVSALRRIENKQLIRITKEQLEMLKKWITAEIISHTNTRNLGLNSSSNAKTKPSFLDSTERLQEYQRLQNSKISNNVNDDFDLDDSMTPGI